MEKSNLTTGKASGLLQVPLHTGEHWIYEDSLKIHTTPNGATQLRPSGVGLLALGHGLIYQQDDANPMRILIADADPAFRMFLVELLKDQPEPMVVDHAHDGLKAIEKIITFEPHILLTSLNLSVVNGIEICSRVKEYPETKSIRIIVITGCRAPTIARTIIDAGADVCLPKPVDTSALLGAIRFSTHSSERIQPTFPSSNNSDKR